MSRSSLRYAAVDRSGRVVRGRIEAGSEAEAARRLAECGLTPIELSAGGGGRWLPGSRVTRGEVASMTRELSVLVDAQIPIGRGMASMSDQQQNPALRETLRNIAAAIESGQSITEALSAHPRVFGEVYIESLRAAERSGGLAPVMRHLADMLERQVASSQALRRALTYPAVVLAAVGLALIVILVFVVPQFAATFASNGVRLPLMTRVVQDLGLSMRAYWWAYLLGAGGAIWGAVVAWRSEDGRRWIESLFPRLPYFGRIVVAVTTARFMRVLSISLGAGIDLTDAVRMSGRATGRPLFAEECAATADRLRGGERLDELLGRSRYLPPFARRMLAAGKDSKDLSRASGIVAEHYDRESDHLGKSISTLIEPVMTFGLAAVVLVVALSVFTPMWEMVRMSR